MSRAPGVAGLDAVGGSGCVAQLLERVAPVAEVLGAVGDQLELAGLDFGAVLGCLKVAQLGAEAVDGAVEAPDLCVEGVHEPPEQALALVGHLEPVRPDALCEDAERFAHRAGGVVFVPDFAGVELAALGLRAEELGVLADGRRHGVFVVLDVVDDVHDALLRGSDEPTGPVRRTLPTCSY